MQNNVLHVRVDRPFVTIAVEVELDPPLYRLSPFSSLSVENIAFHMRKACKAGL